MVMHDMQTHQGVYHVLVCISEPVQGLPWHNARRLPNVGMRWTPNKKKRRKKIKNCNLRFYILDTLGSFKRDTELDVHSCNSD
jgi:hypothetical protein